MTPLGAFLAATSKSGVSSILSGTGSKVEVRYGVDVEFEGVVNSTLFVSASKIDPMVV